MAEPLKITLYARVGDSEVLNEIGTVEATDFEVGILQLPDETAAPEATKQVTLDLAAVLRAGAASLEGRARPNVSAALHRIHQG